MAISVKRIDKSEFMETIMLVDFNEIKEITIPGMNNGTGEMSAKMHMSEKGENPIAASSDRNTGMGKNKKVTPFSSTGANIL